MSALGQVLEKYLKSDFVKIIFSGQKKDIKKVIVRPIILKGEHIFHVEKFIGDKAFHDNIQKRNLLDYVIRNFADAFKQINVMLEDLNVNIIVSKKDKIHVAEVKGERDCKASYSHNKEKRYIFEEGQDNLPLRDLGIFTQDNKIIKSKFDKYKQINRFMEVIDHEMKNYEKDSITILDFGCGKSYLTFLVYHYFKNIKNIDVTVYGYDLKEDVVLECNKIAKKYNYDKLHFISSDIKDVYAKEHVDMMLSLHACDIATDFALAFAVQNDIKYIFSVPCCQHEVNSIISSLNCEKILLNHGVMKERFSALLTDAVRCDILHNVGYDVDVLEFIDFSNSPKNLLIRAVKNGKGKSLSSNSLELLEKFGSKQKLYELLYND